ncbi:MAG: radical SAM protein [Methylococcales bacterium]|nr:radical SAM protein [Methylococcales bacterium]
MPQPFLTTANHDRDIAGLKYIYPVMSRRAGGLSIGVNFNPNNACNWRCIYCQVPDLKPGNAPGMDFEQLGSELRSFLDYVQHGDFFQDFNIEAGQGAIKDIAISGNGEPTSLEHFPQAIALIGEIARQAGVFPAAKFVLISNGSLLHRASVQAGLAVLAGYHGELWLKLDSATAVGRKFINNSGQSQIKLLEHLKIAGSLCATRLQTCMFHYQGRLWTAGEKQAYLQLLQILQEKAIPVQGVMLYTLARPSFQPEAGQLVAADSQEMTDFAAEIRAMGYEVSVSR